MGENAAQRMGELCPGREEEHRVAGRTRKTAWGAQTTVSLSSAVRLYESLESASSRMDLVIVTRVGALEGASFRGGREM